MLLKILFMGGHELGKITLEHLIDRQRKIAGVVVSETKNEWYKGVDEVALSRRIPLFIEKDINCANFLHKVREIAPDLILAVNFEQIFKDEIISIPKKGCINTHASLLPKYRGRAPLNWAMINNERETGVTVHYIDKGIDTGDIILQKKIPILSDEYIGDILKKVKNIYPEIVNEAVKKIETGNVYLVKQDLSKGFYCGKRTIKDGQINWGKRTADIYNLIRAVSRPYPGAYTYYGEHKMIIWRASLSEQEKEQTSFRNGTILIIDRKGILVKTENANLWIAEYEIVSGEGKMALQKGGILCYRED